MDTTAVLLHAIRSAISPTARSVSDKREMILRTSVSDNLLPCRAIRFPPGKRVPLFCNQKSSVAAYKQEKICPRHNSQYKSCTCFGATYVCRRGMSSGTLDLWIMACASYTDGVRQILTTERHD